VDAESGRTYYYHSVTGEVTWVDQRPPGSDRQTAPAKASAAVEWSSAIDAASGKTYYYNAATGETKWA
jgi:outer membrane protein assembly factor BamB